jgi:hypothetical protein
MAEIITCRNIGGMKIKEKLKAKFESAIRNARIPGTQSQLEKLNFARCRLIFSTQLLSLFSLHTKIRYQFTRTEHKTPDVSEVYRSLQNFGSSE